jgi:cytochrome c oxidase subunit 1
VPAEGPRATRPEPGPAPEAEPPVPVPTPYVPESGILGTVDRVEQAVRGKLAQHPWARRIFLLDRDWITRITMLMVLAALTWAVVGSADALSVRLQEWAWATSSTLPLPSQTYYSAITLHAMRLLFGLVQQLTMAVVGFLLVLYYRIHPSAKWLLYSAVGIFNLGLLLTNGPPYLLPRFNDAYFPATGWYFLSPIGLPGYSAYVVTPFWFWGWILLSLGSFAWVAWMLLQIARAPLLRRPVPWPQKLPVWAAVAIMTTVFTAVTWVGVFVASIQDLLWLTYRVPFDPLVNQVLFWQFGHSLVYLLFFLGILAVYWLVPVVANRPVYSWRAGILSVVLYFVFSGTLSIHHLYLTPLPTWSIFATMLLSYGVILPSAITFFTLWLTTKGAPRMPRSPVTYFLLFAWGGVIAAGLSGGAVGTVSFDLWVHNTLFVVSHFHAMLLMFILPTAFAALYVAVPLLTGRRWFSRSLSLGHFVLSAIGATGFVFAFEVLGSMGLLRRTEIFPHLPGIVAAEEAATIFAIVFGIGQILLLANLLVTVLWGEHLHLGRRSFNSVVHALVHGPDEAPGHAGRTNAPAPYGSDALARARAAAARHRWERLWLGTVVGAIVLTTVFAAGPSLAVPNAVHGQAGSADPAVYADMVGHQYYWSVNESGAQGGEFDNLVVVPAGASVELNLSSVSVTQAVYLPFRTQGVINVQVVPGYVTHALFTAPTTPGIYPMPEAEYDGPWFPLDMAALIVLPPGGAWSADEAAAYTATASATDLYAPTVWQLGSPSVQLTSGDLGIWEDSIPGPTLVAPAGTMHFDYTVPLGSIDTANYLVNTTTTDGGLLQQKVTNESGRLPDTIGLYQIGPSGLTPRAEGTLTVGGPQELSAPLAPGTYVYGVVTPTAYTYDPNGESSPITGAQSGYLMGLWGALFVTGTGSGP